jgi:hypothetical protein
VDHADLILTEYEETSVSQQLHNTDLLPGCTVVAADRQAAPAYERRFISVDRVSERRRRASPMQEV